MTLKVASHSHPNLSAPQQWHETIIVGGGMSGLGCAHRLREQGKSFLMVTPDIGGRVRTAADGIVNYGAYYVTDDYHWTLPLVKTVQRVRITDAWFHRHGKRYRFHSLRLAKHLPALIRFSRDLHRFRCHFNRMNEGADNYSRKELIEASPMLRDTYNQCAGDYIRERKLEGLFADFIDPLLWASFFHDPRQVSTFMLLAASLPLIVPMYSFVFDADAAASAIHDKILRENVTTVDLSGPIPRVTTVSGQRLRCRDLVLATPMNVTNRLLGEDSRPIRRGIDVSYYHVRGTLRPQYRDATRSFFHSDEGAVLSREHDGSFLYFYQQDRIDRYFEDYQVIAKDIWKPALFFLGSELIEANPLPHVFIASDHDVPSMENAYLNGRYTANLVLRTNGFDRRRQPAKDGLHCSHSRVSQSVG